jgi:hypothetical protein
MELVTSSTDASPLALDATSDTGAPSPQLRLARTALLGLAATLAIVAGALLGGRGFETHLPGAWFFGMPGGLFGSLGSNAKYPPIYALALVFGGLILLVRVWFGFMRQLRIHTGFPVKKVVLVVAIWALPLLLAPPLFSRDVYTYAGQGEMVSHHIDPYTYGPGVLGSTPFSTLPDSVWSNAPSPYGPTFLEVDGLLADASGHKILPDIVLLRLLEIAGLALVVAATPALARGLKRDPAEAILLGAGSPLALIYLVAAAHNDALMLGLLMAGLAVAKRFGTIPGIILCALAAGVKSPAALGVLFLGWVWAGHGASVRRRVAHTLAAGAVALATMEVVAIVTGDGWGWLRTTTTADQSFTGVTPVNVVARIFSGATHVIQLPISTLGARSAFSVIGLLIAAAIGIWLLLRAPRDGVERALGLTLLVVALFGPILWAWYVTWGIIVLAPAALGRLRTTLIVISTYETFVGATSVHGIALNLAHSFILPDLVLVAVLMASAILPLGQFRSPSIRLRPERTDAGLATLGLHATT